MPAQVCPYCKRDAELVNGDQIYPHRPDLSHKLFWLCRNCTAYVGCHPGSSQPLGRMADAALRKAKMSAHAAFDPIWQSKEMSRRKAYAWLAEQLGIAVDKTHIGMFDQGMCLRVIEACKNRKKKEVA